MPCNHKFQGYLNLELIDFEPTTLIVGTFNPEWPEGNPAQWFYGRTENNNFWDVLPRLYLEESLINGNPEDWKRFCSEKQIAITDIISCIEDADENSPDHQQILDGYGDLEIANNFYDFELTNIVRLLRNHETITNVYVTRGITEAFWRNALWPLRRYCEAKQIGFNSVLTPSGYAYLQQGRYNRENPDNQLDLADYILMRWQQVWHQIN